MDDLDPSTTRRVALRKESVDRNISALGSYSIIVVALRKESVDRNTNSACQVCVFCRSLSARRAWIEIIDYVIDYVNDAVALRKESVDRNDFPVVPVELTTRRSPQGERG